MAVNMYEDLDECIRQARAMNMDVYEDGREGYDKKAEVYNARIHTRPAVIAFCKTPEHIAFWLRCAEEHQYPILVRSGGHHHEGMCVETGAITLDMAAFSQISLVNDGCCVDLGPSARLGEVSKMLTDKGKALPVGGCGTVCVGGLVQGGGWGPLYRSHGLTIDKLCEVDIVMPNGDMLTLNKSGVVPRGNTSIFEKDGARIFRAIRGGGGGNFGVVTRFRFGLTELSPESWEITLQWTHRDRLKIAKEWAKLRDSSEPEMTTFCRLTVVEDRLEHDFDNPAVLIGGRYQGSFTHCMNALQPLLTTARPKLLMLRDLSKQGSALLFSGAMGVSTPNGEPRNAQGYALNVGGARTETCLSRREPHKVTCVFPEGDGEEALSRIDQFLSNNSALPETGGNAYVSLHGLGGQGSHEPPGGTSFSWRDKPFIIQVQAWWNNGSEAKLEESYIDWVRRFRSHLKGVSSGSFINFPDHEVPVSEYYSEETFQELKRVKRLCDPRNVMRFRLSIPLDAGNEGGPREAQGAAHGRERDQAEGVG